MFRLADLLGNIGGVATMQYAILLSLLLPLSQDHFTTAELASMSQKASAYRNTCGPVSAYYALQRLGSDVSLSEVLKRAQMEEEGITVKSLLKLIRSADPTLRPRPISVNPRNLSSLPIPSILILDGHCAVYDGLRPGGRIAVVFDPARRRTVDISLLEIERIWKGPVIVFDDMGMPAWAYMTMVASIALGFVLLGWCCRADKQ